MKSRYLALFLAAACGGPGAGTEPNPTLPNEHANDPVLPGKRPAEQKDEGLTPKPPAFEEPKGDPWADRTDLIKAPPVAKPAAVALPKIERFTLDNGLRVLVVPGHDLPVVSFHMDILSGDGDEPRDKRLVSDFVSEMLTKGTKAHDADQIAQTIESVGGVLGAQSDLEKTVVSCTSLAKDEPTCLGLLGEVVVTPTFPEKEMKQVFDGLVSELRKGREDPQLLVSQHLENAFWGEDQVRGWPATPEALQAITQKDLVAWHKTHFVPNNAVLVIAGDVDPAKVRAAVGKTFGDWKRGKVPAAGDVNAPKLKGMIIRVIDKPDATQSQIAIAGNGVAHKDADYVATTLVNYTLGGGAFSSRLMKVVRSQGAKTYGANSSFERWRTRGMFEIHTFTRNVETVATIELILGELKKMHEAGPTDDELAAAKSHVAGVYPTLFESASDVAAAVTGAELHELGEDYVRQFPLKIDAVTLDQAKAAAKKHVDPDNLVIVIVGKAEDLKPQLDKAGWKYEVVDWLAPISKRDRDAAAKKAAPAAVDPAKTTEGKKLLDQALAAAGGEAKVRAIKDVVSTGKVTLDLGNGQKADGAWTSSFVIPDKMRIEVNLPTINATVAQVITPTGAWQAVGPQAKAFPPEAAKDALAGLWREHDVVLLRHEEAGTIVQSAGKEKVGAEEYDAVVLRRADGSGETKLLLDAKHHLFRISFTESGAPSMEQFADYREVDGVSFPFKQHAEGGQQAFDVVVDSVKVNGGVAADAFTMPK